MMSLIRWAKGRQAKRHVSRIMFATMDDPEWAPIWAKLVAYIKTDPEATAFFLKHGYDIEAIK